jgi:SET domain-containing protein
MAADKKAQLLQVLQHHSKVILRPSAIEGIGVFALTAIRSGEKGFFSSDTREWIPLLKSEVEALPAHSRYLVENFCLYDETHYYVPEYGFTQVDLVIYLNHSDEPNIRSINDGEDFEALRDITAGEELLIDYGNLVDHPA